MQVKITLNILRIIQAFFLGMCGFSTIERLWLAPNFWSLIAAILSFVITAAGATLLLTATDRKFVANSKAETLLNMSYIGSGALIVGSIFGFLSSYLV